ncbi:MAG: anthranilate synthase component II [Pirellula sp.]|jgi:anthranilate synthase/aminodeoxychorismate synthase-like glutamine amidotransferase
MILLLDNYDSFVYNLDRYLQRLGQSTLVVRSDAIQAEAIGRLKPTAIVISPGPKSPDDAGCSVEVIRRYAPTIPILGVCLGHQAIGQAFGAKIVRGSAPMHGKASEITHRNSRLLSPLPTQFQVGRYHSLVIDPATLPSELLATAWSDDGAIMAVEHRDFPVFGVQFHPESILTRYGYEILASFLRLGGHTPGPTPQPDWLRDMATIT